MAFNKHDWLYGLKFRLLDDDGPEEGVELFIGATINADTDDEEVLLTSKRPAPGEVESALDAAAENDNAG